jgi:hypothetical protein
MSQSFQMIHFDKNCLLHELFQELSSQVKNNFGLLVMRMQSSSDLICSARYFVLVASPEAKTFQF